MLKASVRWMIRIAPVFYMIIVWIQSSKFNPSQIEHVFYNLDYKVILLIGTTLELGHLIQFGILYLLLIAAFLTFGDLTKRKERTALIIAITYSFIDETHQYFVPYRSFSIIDMVKNLIGIWFMWWLVRKTYSKGESRLGGLFRGITKMSQNKPAQL